MADMIKPVRLSAGQRLALAVTIMMALVLAAYGAVGSYTTITEIAAALRVPFPHLVPIGIDGGLVGVIVLDLVLAWTGHPLGWLRQLARLLTIGTVAANISAGWPDPIAVGLHAAAPVMLLAMVEAGRAVLLRRAGLASGLARDRIPIGRWLLSPWRTWLLWRRMILWQITNYRDALNTEAEIRRARTLLRIHYGHEWKHTAPPDLVWMLTTAPFAREACVRITMLTNATTGASTQGFTASAPQPAESQGNGSVDHQPDSLSTAYDDQLRQAVSLNETHWAARNRPVSADTVREHLRIGAARARELTRVVRAMDKENVQSRGKPHEVSGVSSRSTSA